jgi:predicted RNA-binding protein associated with RNAse of E/G family
MYETIKKYLNNQIDRAIKDLLHEAGIKTERKGYKHFNYLSCNNTILKDTGYRIEYKASISNDNLRICLYHEDRIAGYEFEVKIKDNIIKVNRRKLNEGDF